MGDEGRQEAATRRQEPYVPCEACELEVPVRTAHMLRAGGFICDGCYRVLAGLDPAQNGSSGEVE